MPALIIRQRVARLTPSSFAEADIPISKGPVMVAVLSKITDSSILSMNSNCPGDADNSRLSLSSVFMRSPLIDRSLFENVRQLICRLPECVSGNDQKDFCLHSVSAPFWLLASFHKLLARRPEASQGQSNQQDQLRSWFGSDVGGREKQRMPRSDKRVVGF